MFSSNLPFLKHRSMLYSFGSNVFRLMGCVFSFAYYFTCSTSIYRFFFMEWSTKLLPFEPSCIYLSTLVRLAACMIWFVIFLLILKDYVCGLRYSAYFLLDSVSIVINLRLLALEYLKWLLFLFVALHFIGTDDAL